MIRTTSPTLLPMPTLDTTSEAADQRACLRHTEQVERRRQRHHVNAHPTQGVHQEQDHPTHHQKRLAKLAARVRKPRGSRRSSANSPEEPTTNSDFEQLLLMMEEHAKKTQPLVIGLQSQDRGRDGGQGRDSNAHDRRRRHAQMREFLDSATHEGAGNTSQTAPNIVTRAVDIVTIAAAPVQAANLAERGQQVPAYRHIEAELMAARQAMEAGHPTPLRLAFEALRQHLNDLSLTNAPTTLRQVKERLLAVTAHTSQIGSNDERAKTFNLLFPLLLLNVASPRTAAMRNQAIGRATALCSRWHADNARITSPEARSP